MDTSSNPLAELKDVHLPADVSMFPLAYGWCFLLAIIIVIMLIVLCFVIKHRKRMQYLNELYGLVSEIENKYSSINDAEIIAECSVLLKRIARDKFSQQNPHMLLGNEWLLFLDRTGKTTQFSNGCGQCFANIYKLQSLDDKEAFFTLIRKWIRTIS